MLHRRKFLKDTTLTSGLMLTGGLGFASELAHSRSNSSNIFLHGVASGDPLPFEIILWTKLNLREGPSVNVKWIVSLNETLSPIAQSGEVIADPNNDFTCKVNVTELNAPGIYYYQFIYKEFKSPTGRTKTIGAGNPGHLQFAVISCGDYTAGYFNALAAIARKKDLDAVIHLGDYIYEGTKRNFDKAAIADQDEYEETHFNKNRKWWLRFYRRRYALNRLDPDLQHVHQAHSFITIWDDHETANNAWKDGASAHDPEKDGDWSDRKSAAKQAYAEWMPIRGNAQKIYRSVRYGNFAEFFFLDTRLEGRDQQIYNDQDPGLLRPDRTILGKEQKRWLLDNLTNSVCQWKLIANQVIFSQINVDWASLGGKYQEKVKILKNTLLDYWEGYPVEKKQVLDHIKNNKISNVVILSASMHCALAFDVPHARDGANVAVEFAAPSLTSANFDEKMEKVYANAFQAMINRKLPVALGGQNPNPNLKFADLQQHGYFILQLNKQAATAQFFFIEKLTTRDDQEKTGECWHTKSGVSNLEKSQGPTA